MGVHAPSLPGLLKRDAAVLGDAENHLVGQREAGKKIQGESDQSRYSARFCA